MDTRDKKLLVLRQLSREPEPISINTLLLKLDFAYPIRSLRRWLNELVREGVVEKTGEKRGTKYVAKEPVIAPALKGVSSCFSSKSLKALDFVSLPVYERPPISYDEEWLFSYQPNVTFYIPNLFRNELLKAGNRSSNDDPAGTYAHQIFNRLLIDLSYNSSRLEGNTYSLLDTKKLLLEGTPSEGKLDEERVMILNHKEAIRYLVDTAVRIDVTEHTICTLHYLLADGLVDAKYAGKVRDYPVRIGGSTYIPIEDPKRLKRILSEIALKASMINDPFEQSFFLLTHISYLQAFVDVNKRTARLSANIMLIKENLVPLSFNDVERQDYMSAVITVYELQDIHPLLDLYLFSYMRTCAQYDATIKAIGIDIVRVRYRLERKALLREVIIKKMVGRELRAFIEAEVKKLIPAADRSEFLHDVEEDLEQIDQSRIAGMGITPAQLTKWQQLNDSVT